MLRELLSWSLHSPRRLVSVAAVLSLGLCVSLWLVADGSGSSSQPARHDSAAVRPIDGADVHTNAGPESSDEPGEKPARWSDVRAATESFLDAYLAGSPTLDRGGVDPRLKRWSTPTLWRGLRLTDPASLPSGDLTSIENVETGAFASEVAATLGNDQTLGLELVVWDDGWRVSDVRPGGSP